MIFRLVEDIDDFIQIDQSITSKETANGNGGGNGRVPRLFYQIPFKPGDVVLDYGCGKESTVNAVINYLGDDIQYFGYDKYNKSSEENNSVVTQVRKLGGADVVACSNLLNVIQQREIRVGEVITNIYKLLKPGSVAYFSVYENNKQSEPRQTGKDTWQEFRPIKTYVDEVSELFGDNVKVKGKVLIATK